MKTTEKTAIEVGTRVLIFDRPADGILQVLSGPDQDGFFTIGRGSNPHGFIHGNYLRPCDKNGRQLEYDAVKDRLCRFFGSVWPRVEKKERKEIVYVSRLKTLWQNGQLSERKAILLLHRYTQYMK